MVIVRTVTVDRPVAEVFAYLSDFTTTEEWDPGTVRTTRVSGDGGVGTTYHNVSRFLGRETELTYVVTDSEPPRPAAAARREQDRGRPRHDDARRRRRQAGPSSPTGRSSTFKGLARLVAPLAAPAFRRLGRRGADGCGGSATALAP